MKRLTAIVLLCLTLIGCANNPHSLYSKSEVAHGKQLFAEGYYRQAMTQLLPMACDGNPEAQYAVGYMYYYGYGVAQDTEVGYMWISRSAAQHYCPAMEALLMIDKKEASGTCPRKPCS